MLSKIKIWHLLLIVFLLILIFRFNYLVELIVLYFGFIKLLVDGEPDLINLVDFKFVDFFVSLALFVIIPIALAGSKTMRQLIRTRLNLSLTVLLLLGFCFFFAPLITKHNPEFQKNISVTKLLPPFSSVKYLTLKDKDHTKGSEIEKFVQLKKSIIPESYNDNIIFVDNLKSIPGPNQSNFKSSYVTYYQGGMKIEVLLDDLKNTDGRPITESKLFLLGSDEFGRDIFTRIVYGSRISMLVGVGSVLLSFIIGISFAFIAAQKGKWIDLFFNRLTDLFLSFPTIFLVIIILALFGSNIISVVVVLGLSGWMSLFKIVKSEIASVKKKDYFISSERIGLKNKKLLIREILPVIIAPVIVNLIFQFSNVILAESALSYLGLGTGTEYPSWGAMIESGQEYINNSWWMIFIPGIILIVTLLSINNVGRKVNKYFKPELSL